MRNEHQWTPSKFEVRGSRIRASRDTKEVGLGSRCTADRIAGAYQNALQEHAGGRLLDVGCGNAPLYGVYRSLVTSSTCLDWGESEHESKHVDVLTDLNEQFPLASNQFDTVLCTDVLEHIWNTETFFDELARVTAPGGKVILGTPFLYPVHEEPHDFYRWTRYALERKAVGVGLEVVSLEGVGGVLDVLVDLTGKALVSRSALAGHALVSVAGKLLARGFARRASDSSSRTMALSNLLVAHKS